MSLPDLLLSLRDRGVELWRDGDALRYRAPDGALSPADRKALSENRDAVLALLGAASGDARAALAVAPRGDRPPLSFAQQRLWFLTKMGAQASEAYHIPRAFRLRGWLDEAALTRALDRLVLRHEALRTRFEEAEGEPFQHVDAGDDGFALVRHDLSCAADPEAGLDALMAEEERAPFDLERGPPVRGRLVRLAGDDHVLLVTMHHIVSDGWSIGIMARELSALYRAYAEGRDDPLEPLAVQYADYAAWQRRRLSGEVLGRQADYWRTTLADAPALLELPADRRRPAQQDYSGSFVPVELDAALTAKLKALGQRHGATLFMTVLAGWAMVLSRLSGQDDVVIGTSSANRTRAEIEGLIGFFVNMLALRLDLSGAPTVAELLARVKAAVLGAQAHQELPFEQVVELVKPARSLSYTPVFQTTFAWQNFEQARFDLPGLAVEAVSRGPATSKFDLTLVLGETEGRIAGGIEYATALFDAATVARYGAYLSRALEEMAEDAGRPVATLPLLSAEERRRLLVDWNDTAAPWPEGRCVHALFEEQVRRDPDAPAVSDEGVTLSYGELDARANRLARRLRALGVKPDDRVAVCAERSPEMVVGLLGILKAGGAYVPLDPAYPAGRLAFMLGDAAPVAVLTHAPARAVLAGLEGLPPVLDLEDEAGGADSDEPVPGLGSRNLAYVIYTSGSTGTPKGVMVEHRGAVNLIMAQRAAFGVGPRSRILQFASLGFDAALFEILLALGSGGALHLRPQGDILAGEALTAFLTERRISHAVLTPSALAAASPPDAAPAEPTALILAGEALPKALADRWAQGYPLFNAYGPTEATIWATLHRCDASADAAPPIGRPIANARVYLLDEAMQPVPAGVAGEIHIGGAGVARGYLNRPELTAERFVDSPFVEGDRLYKTGDLGRFLLDGSIEFLGRNDFQVKVRGFRIEPGEIEARLLEHPAVREAVVLAREDRPGDTRLVAYVTGGAEPASLRAHLAGLLPEHMVPAAYMRLDTLPLTPNGKLDRNALPAPEARAFPSQAYEPPAGPAEVALAAIWAEVLGLERVGRNDDFFDLGGHSLLAVRTVSRIRQVLGVEVALTDLFGHPLLRDFAAVLAGSGREILPPVVPEARGDRPPLSFAQQRLWFLARMGGGASEAYNVPLAFRLRGRLDEAALRRALDRLVHRHEALRTSFPALDGEPFLRIGDAGQGLDLRADDLSAMADPETALDALTAAEGASPFDLERGPLVRGRLVRLAGDDHVLLLTLHHSASDGWSLGVLTRELSALYRAYAEGRDDPLEPLAVQYADYAAWQRRWLSGEALGRQAAYWRTILADAPALLELPADRRRPAQQDYSGGFVPLALDAALTAKLKALGQRHGATLFMTVLAGWALVLSRLSGQEDVVIGTSSANRTRAEIEGLIGFFVNMLALRLDLSGAPTVAELLARVKAAVLGAQAHQELPFEQVVELVKPARSLSCTPVFQTTFAWQNFEQARFDLPGLSAERLVRAPATSKFDLTLSLGEAEGRIAGGVEYATTLFDAETVARYGSYLRRVLEGMVADEAWPVAALPLLSGDERRRLLVDWNDTAAPWPKGRCIHELFEEQARRAPDAPAVLHGDVTLSYGGLNARANRLANRLRALGVGPDRLVAVCAERSVGMVVGLLGILKAGGAYVPLDPAYPAERLGFMLGDAAPVAVLTHGPARAALDGLENLPPVLDLEDEAGAADSDEPVPGLTSGNLAYVIYTSGSTGTPKGVMVEHGALVNHTAWFNHAFEIGPDDIVLQRTPFTFDASVWEIFSTLAGGARLRLASGAELGDVDALAADLRGGVTRIQCVPLLLEALLATRAFDGASALRTVFCGGDALRPAHRRDLAAQSSAELVNLYGPTEATIESTSFTCTAPPPADALSLPIGRPISNARVYLLDRRMEPVPVGVAGEIHIGGAGVARGYLNRPELTAERFVDSPFVEGDRLYRTGDLGRFLPDGTIEFLGRSDFQVKVRGFRIEPGEIETRLLEHPAVREAVVVAREDQPGDTRLVAYAVLDGPALKAAEPAPGAARAGEVAQWQAIFDETYGTAPDGPGFTGWNSSHTGEPIPEPEMQAWLDATLERIRAFGADRILEIGCGAGLLLQHLAPGRAAYTGTDLSPVVLDRLRRWASGRPELAHVELLCREAADFEGLAPGSFDAVVLNSVVQYFPDGDYLLRVLSGALRVLRPGGTLFVGDVRNRELQECFYAAVSLSKAEDGLGVEALRRRVARAIRQEKELVIAPGFFRLLGRVLPEAGRVAVLLKQGGGDNELTRYRYDVAIRKGGGRGEAPAGPVLPWREDVLPALESLLREGAAPVVRVTGVPNRRLAGDLGALRRLREADGEQTVAAFRTGLGAEPEAGAAPEAFRALGERYGYAVAATWTPGADGTCFDVVMAANGIVGDLPVPSADDGRDADPLDHLNDPLAARLKSAVLGELKAGLEEALPEHMVPGAFVSIDALPLTPNGKLDRRALPPPDGEAFSSRTYEPPTGPVEEKLAAIWAEVLGLERVGRTDNFFDLGGHSLLAVRVLERMRREGLQGDVRMLFAAPSLADLAAEVRTGTAAAEVPANRIPRGCTAITPDMLPLVSLEQAEIDRIVAAVPGGAANVQDIYPLAPLQEGILFHHLTAQEGDAYLMAVLMGFADRARFDGFVAALNSVVARHDILRTGVLWEGLSEPVQVVRRHARLEVEEVALDPAGGDVAERLRRRYDPRHYRLDVRRAPAMRLTVAQDPVQGRWVAVWLLHHMCSDHTTMEVMLAEVQAHLLGRASTLPAPLPFRNFVAQARRGLSAAEHEAFFRSMLGDVDEPSAPFGLLDVLGDGSGIEEARRPVEAGLSRRLRAAARALKVSPASLMHVAWGQVVARTSGRRDPVFGTVLFGRMQGGEGADRVMGLFLNTLPLRLRLGPVGAQDSVVETHRLLGELMRHEHASLALAKQCSALSAQTPLFTSLFNYRYTARGEGADAERLKAWAGIEHISVEDRTNYPLTVSVDDFGEDFALTLQVGGGLGAARICAMMHRALETLVEALERTPSAPVGRLDVLPPEERHRLLVERNDTAADYPKDRCIHELVEDQAAATPDATALSWEGGSLSYGELNARANRLAHHLRALGVKPDDRVAICVERSPEMILGLLAIMKAGGAYLPLDPDYPAERLAFMIEDSAPVAALTHEAARATFEAALGDLPASFPVLDLIADAGDWADRPDGDPRREDAGLSGKNIAYITYTSGSTGKPKGIMQEHDGVADRLMWLQDVYGMSEGDVVPAKTTFCFDDSAFEFFWTLSTGARLVITRPDAQKDPAYLVDLAIREGVTVMHFVPSVLSGFVEQPQASACTTLRLAFCSGEELPMPLMRRFWSVFPQAALHNLYGPSEAAVDATEWACDRESMAGHASVPIGRAIRNVRIYLLDEWMEPVPEGIAGEIHVGGAGVARGYQNRPELTAERFVDSPFVTGDRLYRTGDLGRFLPDGSIEFLGRNDFQVKIRGFRIELGEIEARLLEHPGVREAVVLARQDQPGDKRLVAYTAGEAEPAALREHLSATLPDYMVPAAYVRLDALPLAPNGKLDRKALPAPDGGAFAFQAYEAPAGPAEEALARIWAEVLGVERVGRTDNFFDLGGHSLLAVRVLERMRREGLQGDVRMLFAAPSLSALAAGLATGETAFEVPANRIPEGCTAITPDMLPLVSLEQAEIDRIAAAVPGGAANVQDIYPLAPLQEGILFHHMMAEAGDAYLMRSLMSFDTRDRLDAFLAATGAMVARHDILRTGVHWEGLSLPVQVVCRHARLEVEEVALDPCGGDVAGQLWARFDPRRYRLDLRQAPMMRFAVAQDPVRDRWVALWLLHHLCTDHTSVDVMLAEVRAHMLGRADALPPPLPFRSFVAQARQGLGTGEHEAFFRAMLGDVDEPTAPFGLLDVLGDGGGIEEARRPVEPELSRRLRAAARTLKVSPASLMHVAWGQVAARASGRPDPVFGTVLFGRMQGGEGAERVMGLFLNTLPVRLRLDRAGARETVAEAHRLLGELMRHEHAPLTLARQCSALAAQAPLFTSLFNYRYIETPERADAEAARAWAGVEHLRNEERTNYPLAVSVNDHGEDFTLVAQIGGGVDPERVCAMMHRALETLVDALERDSATPVSRLDVLAPEERRRLLVDWNDTATPWPEGRCVHELFEEQARRIPDATAVLHGAAAVSYAELNAMANRVAHRLRALGVKPDDRVAVCLERSPEMVAGLLGILKAGGAYVPLDLAYPADRLAYMLRDSAPVAVLTHAPARAVLDRAMAGLASPLPVVDLDEGEPQAPGADLDMPVPGLTSRSLAYVIYTSGSTGTPKGVMVEHGSLVNRLSSTADRLAVGPGDVFAALAPISFDISCLELWLPLGWGFRTAIADRATAVDGEALGAFLDRSGASIVQATPGTWRLLARAGDRRRRFKALCGGEALPADVRDYLLRWSTEAWNVYGPTETTVWSTEARIEASGLPIDHVGRPIANTRVYVLDGALEPVPVGVMGEICIGGPCVTRGYQGRPELTQARFVENPFVEGERLYRTGDLGRFLPDGNVEFLGRNDFQVKVRGFRIELGEIEARLLEHPAVRGAVVLAREDQPGDIRLVAYVTGEAEPASLRGHLAGMLPDHMVPAAYVRLDALPLSPNGKVDRKALPAPGGDAFASRAGDPPAGPAEEALAAIWAEVLGLERVGRDDDFFDLGGHSLLAVRMASRIRQILGVEVGVKAVFDAPTVAGMKQWLAASAGAELERFEQASALLAAELDRMSEAEILARLQELEAE